VYAILDILLLVHVLLAVGGLLGLLLGVLLLLDTLGAVLVELLVLLQDLLLSLLGLAAATSAAINTLATANTKRGGGGALIVDTAVQRGETAVPM
jgi:hypothetical protein